MALASDLHWLISEGHVIEFNDGALDLPRVKPPAPGVPASATPLDAPNGSTGEFASPNQLEEVPLPESASPLTDPEVPANVGDEKEISAPTAELNEPLVQVAPPDGPVEAVVVAESTAASIEPGSPIEIPSTDGNSSG